MCEKMIVRTEKDYKVSRWSGGDTTELYLYPEDGDYKSGNFQLRISSATVDVDRSEFTSLPGVERYLMIFQGHLDMVHGEEKKVSLEPYEVDRFDGGVPTVSYGRVVDFNLMLKNGAKGRMEALCLVAGQEWEITPDENENFLVVYVREGEILSRDFTLTEKETFVQKEWRKSIIIKNPGPISAKMGICRGSVDKE